MKHDLGNERNGTIAITGANGFVGSALLKHLAGEGRSVRGIMRRSGDPARLARGGWDVRFAELDDVPGLGRALQGCRAVVHCAARSLDWGSAAVFHSTNVLGTEHLAEAAAGAGVERLVLMSTANVAGFGKPDLTEEHSVRTLTFRYSRSKLEAEKAAARLCSGLGVSLVVLRPSAVYGPEDRKWSYQMIRLLDESAWPLIKGGRALFTPIYIDNLAYAVQLALDTTLTGTYNLTDGVTISWLDFCERIARALGRPLHVRSFPYPVALSLALASELYGALFGGAKGPALTRYRVIRSSRDFLYSSDRARRELGFRPDPDIDAHIRETVRWYREVSQ